MRSEGPSLCTLKFKLCEQLVRTGIYSIQEFAQVQRHKCKTDLANVDTSGKESRKCCGLGKYSSSLAIF